MSGAAHEHARCLAVLGLVASALGLNADALGPPATALGLIAAAQKPAAAALRLDATALRLAAAHAGTVMEGHAGRPAKPPYGCRCMPTNQGILKPAWHSYAKITVVLMRCSAPNNSPETTETFSHTHLTF